MGDPVDAPFSRLRFQRQDRLAVRHLSAGRMEDHQQADPECRACGSTRCVQYVDANQLSPRISLTWKPYRRHHLPRRLCAQLHAAAAGAGRADQSRAGAGHDAAARRCRRTIRCCRSAPTCSMSASIRKSTRYPASKSASTATTRPRAICSTTASSAQAYVLTALQLRPRRECRRRTQGVLHQRQFPRLRQSRLGETDRHQGRVEPVSVRSRRTRLHRQPLHLHRPRPAPDRRRPAHPICGTARASARR